METDPDTGRIHVGHIQANYLVPSGLPGNLRIQSKLDNALQNDLPPVLSSALEPLSKQFGNQVVLIRRIETNLTVNAAWTPNRLARAFAATFARTLAPILAGDDSGGVLRFPNREAYLAQFLSDLSNGSAWGKWYYERFRGLRPLPVSAAVRTALCEKPTEGLAALLHLPDKARLDVLRALTAPDADRVMATLSYGTHTKDITEIVQVILEAWRETKGSLPRPTAEAHDTLRLVLQIYSGQSEPPSPAFVKVARAFLRLVRRLSDATSKEGKRILASVASRDVSETYRVLGAADAETLAPLRDLPRAKFTGIEHAVRERLARPASPLMTSVDSTSEERGYRFTALGGLFFLLPILDAHLPSDLTRHWPSLRNTPAAAMLRLLVAAKCLGAPRVHQVLVAPLVREVLGVDPRLSIADITKWGNKVSSRTRIDTLLSEMACWHKDKGAIGGDTLCLTSVSLSGAPVGILTDPERGLWVDAVGCPPGKPDRMIERVRRLVNIGAYDPSRFVVSKVFADFLQRAYPGAAIDIHDDSLGSTNDDHDAAASEPTSASSRVAADFTYLMLPRALDLSRAADLALSVAAQNILRAFAWRLPGFGTSSAPYLYKNFLDVPCKMEDLPGRRIVHVGRPPLQFVLNMTGIPRESYTLSWLDGGPFELFQDLE